MAEGGGREATGNTAAPAPRRVIQLPSFREVQAAQRPTNAPTLFRAGQSPSAAPQSRPAAPPAVASGGQSTQQTVTASVPPPVPAAPRPPQHQSSLPTISQPRPGYGNSQPWQQQHAAQRPPGPMPSAMGASTSSSMMAPPAGQLQSASHLLATNPNAILVSQRQKGNPVLKHIVNVRKEFADIVPDYIIGSNSCALFLSLRYHLLKPDYIHFRMRELQRSFTLRVLLCHVDVDDVVEPLQQVTRAAIANQITLVCAWSHLECARYLETFKAYESKPADLIQGRAEEDYMSRLNAAITTVRGINRTDVLTLGGTFQTAAGIMQASMEDLSLCPGIGPTKIRRLYDAFHEPFRRAVQPRAQETTRQGPHGALASTSQGQQPAVGVTAAKAQAADLIVFDSEDDADDQDFLD
ncbi:hypothetical protein WJX73_000300 [Symbiochloris irregularis]|uniref:DNA excision repair protein ERCC-1 n=1 Tax=Symbiochloris irregularis TaxID=706552 RepID=A0AAW1NUI4_9CHLO